MSPRTTSSPLSCPSAGGSSAQACLLHRGKNGDTRDVIIKQGEAVCKIFDKLANQHFPPVVSAKRLHQ